MLTLIPAILTLIEQGIPVVQSLIDAARIEISLFESGAAPTAAQQATIDAALDQANAALQAAQPTVA